MILYLVAPSILAVLHSWPKLATLNLLWFIPAVLAEGAHFACTFSLQRIALRTKAWFPVITAQLSGNAISLIVPGGAAAGAAVQFRMLGTAGMDPTESVSGLTAFSFLGIGGLLALPVFVLPVVVFGAPVASGLSDAAWIGAIGFVLFTGFGVVVMATDAPLLWVGRAAQAVRNRVLKKRARLEGLPERLLEQRERHPRRARPAVVAGHPPVGRPAALRLPVPAVLRAGRRRRPAPVAHPAGLCRGRGHRAPADHPGGHRRGRGQPGRLPGPGRPRRGPGGARHPGLPPGLVLAADAAGPVAYAVFRHRYRDHGRPTPELGTTST